MTRGYTKPPRLPAAQPSRSWHSLWAAAAAVFRSAPYGVVNAGVKTCLRSRSGTASETAFRAWRRSGRRDVRHATPSRGHPARPNRTRVRLRCLAKVRRPLQPPTRRGADAAGVHRREDQQVDRDPDDDAECCLGQPGQHVSRVRLTEGDQKQGGERCVETLVPEPSPLTE